MDVRFARDAILQAEANRTAMRELIPTYLANTEVKLSKVESRLKDYRRGRRKPKRATLGSGAGWSGTSPDQTPDQAR